jgi:hypothetical protein
MVYAPTSYNRSVCASPPVGGSGFHSPRSVAALLPTAHSTHSFAGLQTYGLLIRPAKPSHTAGTLCEMGFEFFGKNNVKTLDLKNKII